jgi:hypothetical protein
MRAKIPWILGAITVGVALSAAISCSKTGTQPQGNTYASIANLPDWSGAWVIPGRDFGEGEMHAHIPTDPLAPALTGEYAAMRLAFNVRQQTGKDPENTRPARANSEQCVPNGMPMVMRPPVAIEFLFTPGRVTILTEDGPSIRRIYTDGRPHSDDPDVTYTGESIGHWEEDTLVVDTKAISDKAQFMGGVNTSGHAHVVERIHLKDAKHLQIDTVVEDSVALTKPWRYSRTYERYPPVFVDYECTGNNRDAADEPDLTPPNAR